MSPSLDLTRARVPSTVGLTRADMHGRKPWDARPREEGFEEDDGSMVVATAKVGCVRVGCGGQGDRCCRGQRDTHKHTEGHQ